MLGTRPISSAPLSSLGQGNYDVALTDTESISDSFTINVYYSEGLSDSLTINDQYSVTIATSISDTLTLTDNLSVNGTYNADYSDTLNILESYENISIIDEFILTDQFNVSVRYTNSLSDSISPNDVYTGIKAVIANYSNTITFAETWSAGRDVHQTLTHSLVFTHVFAGSIPIDIALCDFIALSEILGNHFDVTLTDTLTITEPNREIVEDDLILVDDYVTNMDNEDCLHPGGYSGERGNSDSISIADSYVIVVNYYLSMFDSSTLYNTTTWRV